jgi:hypothetical protein
MSQFTIQSLRPVRTRLPGISQTVGNKAMQSLSNDLRRTCVRLCHQEGGELEQIQFLLGHLSVQTTERYLGRKQRFHNAVNDRIGLEPDPGSS